MKRMAARPQNAPRTALRTRSQIPVRMYGGTSKIRTFPSNSLATAVETTEAITMGANVAAAKSPRRTSRLKKTPPMGALKTAAIPPAAPHATKMRMRLADTLRNCPTADPIAAPIWAIGASRPTEPPEPIVTAAVRVRSPTVRGRMIPPCNATASIALGTPSPLASVGNRWRSGPIRRPPSSGRRNTRYGGLPIAWKIPPKKSFSKKRMSRRNATAPRPARPPMIVASRKWNISSPMWNRSRIR